MQHKPPRSAKRTFPPHIHRRLTAVSATCRRISSTLAIVALVSLLVLWSILMAVSRDNEAHAQIALPTTPLTSPQRDSVSLQTDLPRISLVSLSPSPVEEGQTLRILVRANRQIVESDTENGRMIGGVQIFDTSTDQSAELHAFAFRAGDVEVAAVPYRVPDRTPTERTIRVRVNPVFAEYGVGSTASLTVQVIGVGDPPPPPPTATFTPTSTSQPPPPPPPTATFTPTNTPRSTATFTPTNTPRSTATFAYASTRLQLRHSRLPTRLGQLRHLRLPTRLGQLRHSRLPTHLGQPRRSRLPTRLGQLQLTHLRLHPRTRPP